MPSFRISAIKNIDLFALFNISLFIIVCFLRYYARFVHYRGKDNISEFFVYAIVIIAIIVILWRSFRHFEVETSLLILLQAGILMHFSGAFVQINGHRLYDEFFLSIRFDKYVHFVNSFVVCIMVRKIFFLQKNELDIVNRILVFFVVLGLGAVVEIVEYGVTRTIPGNGVGDYDNNMQDLISNSVGGLLYLWITSIKCLPTWFNHIVAKDRTITETIRDRC